MFELQGSLLDVADEVSCGALGGAVERRELGAGAWVDLRPGWVAGAGVLFDALATGVPWRAERRQMYDREVDVPRLLSFYGEGDELPHPALVAMRAALDAHYGRELGEPFRTAGLCLYRDGRDSVAWHGDRIGRSRTRDTMVAIVSVGAPRALLLRPRGGGAQVIRHLLGHGDLIVMGGSCQRTWDHAVPEDGPSGGPADQHPVPPARGALTVSPVQNDHRVTTRLLHMSLVTPVRDDFVTHRLCA